MGNIDFKMIYVVENSNKFQKTRFWNEKSVEDVVTLGPMTHATLVTMKQMNNAKIIKEKFNMRMFLRTCLRLFFK
jgi:hypothetical protein